MRMAATVAVLLVGAALFSTFQAVRATRARNAADRASAESRRSYAEAREAQASEARLRGLSDERARDAVASRDRSRRLLYVADMSLAQQSLKQNNLGKVRRLLDRHRPGPGEEDLRGWEWRYLWQQTRSTAIATLTNRAERTFDVSLNPDGSLLAAGWYDGHLELWDVASRRMLEVLVEGKQSFQAHATFAPDRNLLAYTSAPNTVTLRDLDSGRETAIWQIPQPFLRPERAGGGWTVRDLSFAKDGSWLVLYAGGNRIRGDAVWVIDVESGRVQGRVNTTWSDTFHHGAARLSPDGSRLFLPRSDIPNYSYTLRCVELATGNLLWETEPLRDYGLTAMAVSPDGAVVLSGSGFEDPTIRIWDSQTGRLQGRLEGHTSWVGKLRFTADGRQLISAASDQTLRVWNTDTWTEARVLRGHRDEVHAVAVSDATDLVASGGKEGNVMLWKKSGDAADAGFHPLTKLSSGVQVIPLNQSRLLVVPPAATPEILSLKGDGVRRVVTEFAPPVRFLGGDGSGNLGVWDGTNRVLVGEFGPAGFIPHTALKLETTPATVSYDIEAQLLAWIPSWRERDVQLVPANAPGQLKVLAGEAIGPRRLQFSKGGTHLAALGSAETTVWAVETGEPVLTIKGRVTDLEFAAGNQMLVTDMSVGGDHEIQFYNLNEPGAEPLRYPGKQPSRELTVSPDGLQVVASSYAGTVTFFDATQGVLIESIHGHLNAAFGVSFSPDGRRLISGGGGREAVKVWDVSTRQELLTLPGAGSFLPNADWSGDGQIIVAGTPWQAWSAPSWEEIARAEAEEAAGSKRP